MSARWPLAALAALVAAWPWLASRYLVFLASLILVNAVVAIGLNLLSGYTNQLSFGHAGFLAIGAYTAALLTIHAPALPVVVALAAAGLLTAAVGLAFGVPCLRLHGLYLAMATLAFGIVIAEAIRFPELGQAFHDRGPGRTIDALATAFARLHDDGQLHAPDPGRAARHFNWLLMGEPLNRAMLLGTVDRTQLDEWAGEAVEAFLAAYGADPE